MNLTEMIVGFAPQRIGSGSKATLVCRTDPKAGTLLLQRLFFRDDAVDVLEVTQLRIGGEPFLTGDIPVRVFVGETQSERQTRAETEAVHLREIAPGLFRCELCKAEDESRYVEHESDCALNGPEAMPIHVSVPAGAEITLDLRNVGEIDLQVFVGAMCLAVDGRP